MRSGPDRSARPAAPIERPELRCDCQQRPDQRANRPFRRLIGAANSLITRTFGRNPTTCKAEAQITQLHFFEPERGSILNSVGPCQPRLAPSRRRPKRQEAVAVPPESGGRALSRQRRTTEGFVGPARPPVRDSAVRSANAHSPSKAWITSSGVASKSGAIRILPRASPNGLGRVAVRSGTSRASGSPARQITTSFPSRTCLTRRERCVFASWKFTRRAVMAKHLVRGRVWPNLPTSAAGGPGRDVRERDACRPLAARGLTPSSARAETAARSPT